MHMGLGLRNPGIGSYYWRFDASSAGLLTLIDHVRRAYIIGVEGLPISLAGIQEIG